MDATEKAIKAAGGVTRVARSLGLAQSTVSAWRIRGGRVPAEHCAQLEALGAAEVRRWDMRPEDWHAIWPELVSIEGAPPVPTTQETRNAA